MISSHVAEAGDNTYVFDHYISKTRFISFFYTRYTNVRGIQDAVMNPLLFINVFKVATHRRDIQCKTIRQKRCACVQKRSERRGRKQNSGWTDGLNYIALGLRGRVGKDENKNSWRTDTPLRFLLDAPNGGHLPWHVPEPVPNLGPLLRLDREFEALRSLEHEHSRAPKTRTTRLLCRR